MLYTSNTFVSYNHPLKEADMIFLGIPFSSSFGAGRFGPVIVRESLDKVTGIEFGEKTDKGINDVFTKLKVCDVGNLEIVPGSFELTRERIKDTIKDIKQENSKSFLVVVGGDDIITLPVAEAVKPKTIIHFDAHSDALPQVSGNSYSNQTWAYHASKFCKIIQIGINTWNASEDLDKLGIKIATAEELKEILPKLEKPIHIAFDIDVFDPSYVKVSFPEGKMMPNEVYDILKFLAPYVSSMSIVEIDDNQLPSRTGFMAAQVIRKVLANHY